MDLKILYEPYVLCLILAILFSIFYYFYEKSNYEKSIKLAKKNGEEIEENNEGNLGKKYFGIDKGINSKNKVNCHGDKKDENDFTGRQKEVFNIYRKLNSTNQHKMQPIPVCIIPKDFL